MPSVQIEPAAPEIRKTADPSINLTQRRPQTASSANDADYLLRDVRLTGVVIAPDLRIAIFAVTGTNTRVLSEGQALKGWRIDRISPQGVVLNGPAGNIVLEPQPDANVVRAPPPVVGFESDQPAAAMAGAPVQPAAVTPIAVYNLSAPTPVQTQGYPNYSPEYYPGYDPYYPGDWSWGNLWDWGWPAGVAVGFVGCWNCRLRGGFFRSGFPRLGFGHPGFVHQGLGRFGFAHASFGGGFRAGGRR